MPETTSINKMIINKTEAEYNMRSIRFLLMTITFMFIVIGILMMLLGISIYSYFHNILYIYENSSGPIFTPSLMCIFLGFILLLISSFGFFGSLKQSTCLVNTYAIILVVMLILKMALVILAFTTSSDTIARYIHLPIADYGKDPEVAIELDFLQSTLRCCGSSSVYDYNNYNVSYNENQSTVEWRDDHDVFTVPWSCCASVVEDNTCERVHRAGCSSQLVTIVIQNFSVLGVVGVSVMFIELLGVIFALLLARCIRKVKSERALMAWKMREQMILATQEEQKHLENSLYIAPQDSSTV